MERPTSGGYETLFRESGWTSSAAPDLRLDMDGPPPAASSAQHDPTQHHPPPPPPPRPAMDQHGAYVSDLPPGSGNAYHMNSLRRALPTPPGASQGPPARTPSSTSSSFSTHDSHFSHPSRRSTSEQQSPNASRNRYSRALPTPPPRSSGNATASSHGPSPMSPDNHATATPDYRGQGAASQAASRPLPRPISGLPAHMEAEAGLFDRSSYGAPVTHQSPVSIESTPTSLSTHPSTIRRHDEQDYFHHGSTNITPQTSVSSGTHNWKDTYRPLESEVTSSAHDEMSAASVLDHYYSSNSPRGNSSDLPHAPSVGVESGSTTTPRPSSHLFQDNTSDASHPAAESSSRATRSAHPAFGSVSFPNAHSYATNTERLVSGSYARPDGALDSAATSRQADSLAPSWGEQAQEPSRWVQTKLLLHEAGGYYDDEDGGIYDEYASREEEEDLEVDDIHFFNRAFLSEVAVQLRDRVPRGDHVKAGVTWVNTFTGKDLVNTIRSFLPDFTRETDGDRRFALATARSLQSQLWVVEVDWDDKPVRDSENVVFKFMSEMEDIDVSGELPSGVLTNATKCYSPSCTGEPGCYAPRCPYQTPVNSFISMPDGEAGPSGTSAAIVKSDTDWTEEIDPVILAELTEQQRNRQTAIRRAILLEENYEKDLAALEDTFITPLTTANPPILAPYHYLEEVVGTMFGNIQEIRRESRRIIDNFAVRLREQSPLIQTVGDIMLEASTDFRNLYPVYSENLPRAEALLAETLQDSPRFAAWIKQVATSGDHRLRYLLNTPANHLKEYPKALQDILTYTPPDDPDFDFLTEALTSIESIANLTALKLWHATLGRPPGGPLQWWKIVPQPVQAAMTKEEIQRQNAIWELIDGEMDYVADLEAMETVFINPLREAEQPIIDRSRLDIFIHDVFHNYRNLLDVHRQLARDLQELQVQQHPQLGVIAEPILNAALNWHEAYMEYVPNEPIALAKVDEEKANNPAFRHFIEAVATKNPAANRFDLQHFVHRPTARLLRYPLLLSNILKHTKKTERPDHPDITTIPQIQDLIANLSKAIDKATAINSAKVALWGLKTSLDGGKFGPHAVKELDLLNPMRELIHQGRVYRYDRQTSMSSGSELMLYLFDNYFVVAKPTKMSKNREGPTRYTIKAKPTPLELLTLGEFDAPPQTRALGLLKGIRNAGGGGEADSQSSDRTVYPFTYMLEGQLSGQYTLWTDSAKAREEWHEKLKHAKVLRAAVSEGIKVFEFTPLSLDTFYEATRYGATPANTEDYTGSVTCSTPFTTVDGRKLIAVGCEQGVWIGIRHEMASLRKVLHVRGVTQLAVLEEFGIFLVLADKSLLAYSLEALVPTTQSPTSARSAAPQRLSVREIVFFTVGQHEGRTLVLYMKRKGLNSVFRVLEPIVNRNVDDVQRPQRRAFGNLLSRNSDWFRIYKDFFIPVEATNVHFLRSKMAIVCSKGFEIMDLSLFRGGSIPIFDAAKVRERPALVELSKKCESARPLAMFRSKEGEFLLCYDSFGVYVDRHGEPNRDLQAIEWEGRPLEPKDVVFHPPYLLLISRTFIEVRHIDTAKLVQIYTGKDLRCTWDGTGGQAQAMRGPGPNGWGEEFTSQEPRIHICRRGAVATRAGARGMSQHIFELTPTLLLNNPLLNAANTSDPNYFPPAPLDHSHFAAAQEGYNAGPPAPHSGMLGVAQYNQHLLPDRRSVSSSSTHTFSNLPHSPALPNSASASMPSASPLPTPSTMTPVQSYPSPMGSHLGAPASAGPNGGGYNFAYGQQYAQSAHSHSNYTFGHPGPASEGGHGGGYDHAQYQQQQHYPQMYNYRQSGTNGYPHSEGAHHGP